MVPEVHTPIKFEDLLHAMNIWMQERETVIESFEKEFAHYVGVPYALCAPSGRVGLYAVLRSLNINRGDKIIVPAYTSPLIPEIVLRCGARPIFAGIDFDTLNIKANDLEKLVDRHTKAIIIVHTFGNPCDIEEIRKISFDNNLVIIEDVAQALGAEYHGQRVGKFGDFSIFSFGFGKNITTMGGGMIGLKSQASLEKVRTLIASSSRCQMRLYGYRVIMKALMYPIVMTPRIYKVIHMMRRFLKDKETLDSSQIKQGFTPFQAALGKVLLKRLDLINDKRAEIANKIIRELEGRSIYDFQKTTKNAKSVYLRLIALHRGGKVARDRVRRLLHVHGFDVPTLEGYDLSRYLSFARQPESWSRSFYEIREKIIDRTLALPTNPSLSNRDLQILISLLKYQR